VLALLYCGVAAGQEPDPLSLDFRNALQRLVTIQFV
jgi:hypothetical protein